MLFVWSGLGLAERRQPNVKSFLVWDAAIKAFNDEWKEMFLSFFYNELHGVLCTRECDRMCPNFTAYVGEYLKGRF